jgi:hypothetical protein
MTGVSRNRPPFQEMQRRQKLPKEMRPGAMQQKQESLLEQDPKKRARLEKQRERYQPITQTEKIVVRARPEKVFYAALPQNERAKWDKTVTRSQFLSPNPKAKIPAPSKAAEGVYLELTYNTMLLGGFQFRYEFVRAPNGFVLQATKGGSILLAGIAESWAFAPTKGGTEVTLTRTYVPRFKWLHKRAVQSQEIAIKTALEGFRKYVESFEGR